MADQSTVPAPAELVYLPRPSWAPIFAAVGLAGLVAGIFAGWFYAVVGALFLVAAIWVMVRDAARELERLPRRQRTTAAVIPAIAARRPASDASPASRDA